MKTIKKSIYIEELPSGYDVRLKTSRTDISIYWFSKSCYGEETAKYNAETHREHLVNALIDLFKASNGIQRRASLLDELVSKLPKCEVKDCNNPAEYIFPAGFSYDCERPVSWDRDWMECKKHGEAYGRDFSAYLSEGIIRELPHARTLRKLKDK